MPREKQSPYLRRMTLADLDQVTAIEQQAFADPWSFDSFRRELAQPHCSSALVLVRPTDWSMLIEQVAGYMVLWSLVDELHIANVAVHPDWRGQGWGEKLIQVAFYLGQLWKHPQFLLEVRRSNAAARRLYEKLGFLQLHVRKDYYRSPVEDALVLYHPHPPKPPSPPIRLHEEALRRPGS